MLGVWPTVFGNSMQGLEGERREDEEALERIRGEDETERRVIAGKMIQYSARVNARVVSQDVRNWIGEW